MIKHKFTVTVNNKPVFTKDGQSYPTFREAQRKLDYELYRFCGWQSLHTATVGQKGSANVKLSWECTWNGRAPKRAPDVIAAEKTRRAAKRQKKQLQQAEWKKEQQLRIVNLRQRIKNQVDHAFRTGKSGTEPASKYITCQECDAPAAFLHLSQKLPPGAAVLDEDTITGAVCTTHSNWGGGNVKIPCTKLEFFYDGIRQIAIKR